MYGIRARPAGAGSGPPQGEGVKMLTPDLFGSIRKRRKVLPSSALKGNTTHVLFALPKAYRFFCSASNKWIIADEVAYDEKHGTFQSTKEFQRAVRPRNGIKQQIDFWPQLGIGQIDYKAPADVSRDDANAFIPAMRTHEEEEYEQAPQQPATMPPPVPPSAGAAAGAMPAPPAGSMLPPSFAQPTSYNIDVNAISEIAPSEAMFDSTTIGDESTHYAGDGASYFGDGQTNASMSQYDGATERGSVVDPSEFAQREDRAQRIATEAKVERHRAQSALNEYDAMESLPRKATKAYSTWMSEFNSKHGFMPDILVRLYPKAAR
eukprot:TRINITY_DN13423_c0_g1_i1.p1 TRINITY_DN13423_c0_g1~~TRINITY_DN13423_c0_g1_i1.p1  ORF type:complete len:344 (+),score=140.90 TRINITY_DN13423_c0_g1_i1:70-1032(+)